MIKWIKSVLNSKMIFHLMEIKVIILNNLMLKLIKISYNKTGKKNKISMKKLWLIQ